MPAVRHPTLCAAHIFDLAASLSMDTTELHFAVPQGVLVELVGIANHPVGHTTVTATSEFGNGLVAKISHFVKVKDFRRSLLWEKDAINQMISRIFRL